MATVKDILTFIESIAPTCMKEDWDNVGLNCGHLDKKVKTILVALDPFANVCAEAKALGADLLVTHHALIWEQGFITDQTEQGRNTLFLIENGIAHIDPDKCTACGACVKACPRSVISLMPESQNVIVRCRNSDVARAARAVCMDACIGCGRCKKECKYDAIVVENGYARIISEKCTRCGECAAVCPCKCITIE